MSSYSNIAIPTGQTLAYTEEEPKDVSFLEGLSAIANTNLTGHKFLFDNNVKSHYDKEEYNAEDATMLMDAYNIPLDKRNELISKSNSIQELNDRSEEYQSVDNDLKTVSDMGGLGLAASFGVGMLDVPSWILGAGVGKVAATGINMAKVTGRMAHVANAAAGGVGAVGSTYMLESSLGRDLTSDQLIVNAGLGFAIGYGSSRMFTSTNPNAHIQASKISQQMINGDNSFNKVDSLFTPDIMKSSGDIMKGSNNPNVVDDGFKATRSMTDAGLQGNNTANDLKSQYQAKAVRTVNELQEHSKSFKEQTGREFDIDSDGEMVNKIGNDVDYKYKNIRNEEIDNVYKSYKDDIDVEIKSIKDSFEHKLTKSGKPTAESKRKLKEQTDEVKKKWKDKAFNEGINNSSKHLDKLLDSVDDIYRPFVNTIRAYKQDFGKEIIDSNLDGLNKIDTNFHWLREYDANKIATNTDGAIEAFKRGTLHNFNEQTDAVIEYAEKTARQVVTDILASDNIYKTIDIDRNIAGTVPKGLKGRKLRINASELTEYMNNDIFSSSLNYAHAVGGKLAAKRTFGIDKNFTEVDYMKSRGYSEKKDIDAFNSMIKSVYGIRGIDPRASSTFSKAVRALNNVNYINFGGWFGVNTLSDIAGIVNDFGLTRTMKIFTSQLTGEMSKQGKAGRRLAKYMGFASEGVLGDRAAMFNSGDYGLNRLSPVEIKMQQGAGMVAKLSGLNMVVDIMDRTASLTSLDYILRANKNTTKFKKNMNRLGLTLDEVTNFRNNKSKFIKTDKDGDIEDVFLDKLGTEETAKIERALSRAVRDTVLKGNELDTPDFLIEIAGSHSMAKLIFQFMRFPVIAYNKLGVKMASNFDLVDAANATGVAAMILGLSTQLKDVAREEKRYDLDTAEGQKNTALYVMERMPHLTGIGLLNTHVAILERGYALATGEEYRGRADKPLSHFGISPQRMFDTGNAAKRLLSGEGTASDIITGKSLLSTNLFWLQSFNNIANDKIKEEF